MRDVEIPSWLDGLPLAPEFRPTDTEFADPISYISKIEKEASAFGICKVIPPLPKPSKKYVYHNLNKSLLKRPELGSDVEASDSCLSRKSEDGEEVRAVFTTRQQELGQSVKKGREAVQPQQGVHKQVWQSGEIYTLEQFESKSKAFAKGMLGMVKENSPLVVESMFWKAASEKPIYVEYANDVPGSGFSEPDGSFQYFHRRRRKRVFRKNHRVRSVCKKYGEDETVRGSHSDQNKGGCDTSNPSLQTSKASSGSPVQLPDEDENTSRQNSSLASNELEGTAGWKLSNSPWNLQVIARSLGSLTRFMPDDIPGVTSPMVYIGMLFSWFAWHVEDHELHSLNFLHTGSPKTWYAVPGDYAFAFEEVVRTHAYGGNFDRLAALSLLGEKTTLLSPEVVVAAKIPCCRLIQNPGEFVVTFPRAYHVGFSHGFNCGEAANFGTSQWLKVAREAAVRRAAMNYLPMLSHQQLLYLLTMSFVSRVPRSLLPGARSSRLRDRQKEEREISVKKAFMEDLLKENKLLAVLLGRQSSYRAVLWDPELLPSIHNESQLSNDMASVTISLKENITDGCSESNPIRNNLIDDISLYMENVNHLCMDDDDFLNDFQVDSGTVACVACGILGFPFMTVIQPSERAFLELLPVDKVLVQEESMVSKCANSSLGLDGPVNGSVSEDCPVLESSLASKDMLMSSISKFGKEWNTSSRFLRPRIFCLEHAIQVEELLQSKGGAKVLVICHSDYQKIKAHAVAVADEIGSPFISTEVPLDSASQEDLNLIDFAIDEEEYESEEDWSSKLGINLHYCVKIRKNSPSKQVEHALKLDGICSDTTVGSSSLKIKWQSRKARSRVSTDHPKPCENFNTKEDEEMLTKSDQSVVKKAEKIIQYSRRNSKPQLVFSQGETKDNICQKQVSAATSRDFSKHRGRTYITNISDTRTSGRSFSETNSSDTGDTRSDSEGFDVHGSVGDELFEIEVLEESHLNTRCSLQRDGTSETHNEISFAEKPVEKNLVSSAGNSCSSHGISVPTVEQFEMLKEMDLYEIDVKIEGSHLMRTSSSIDMCDKQADEKDVSMNLTSDVPNSTGSPDVDLVEETVDAQLMNMVVERPCMEDGPVEGTSDGHLVSTVAKSRDSKFGDPMSGDRRIGQENQSTDVSNEDPVSSHVLLVNRLDLALAEESSETAIEISAAEGLCHCVSLSNEVKQEIQIVDTSCNELQHCVRVTDPVFEENSDAPMEIGSIVNLFNDVTSSEVRQRIQDNIECNVEEPIPSYLTLTSYRALPSIKEISRVPNESCAEDNLDSGVQPIPAINRNNEEEAISSNLAHVNHSTPHLVEERSDDSKDTVIAGDLYNGSQVCSSQVSMESSAVSSIEAISRFPNGTYGEPNLDSELQPILRTNGSNEEDPSSSNLVHIKESTTHLEEEKCDAAQDTIIAGDMCDDSQVCSSEEKTKQENIESTHDSTMSTAKPRVKRKRELDQITDNKFNYNYIRSPCEGLRPRAGKDSTKNVNIGSQITDNKPPEKRARQQPSDGPTPTLDKKTKGSHRCELEGCRMSFRTKSELLMHQRNQCPIQGCRKKFSCHRYAVVHHRVHEDERPLKCSWKGCTMSFKWAWARTEHLRVHTGERPYKCMIEGCGLSFRFISDFSRHRRKSGHYVNPPA